MKSKENIMFPEIRLDYNFNIIQSNEPAQMLIENWNCRKEGKLPVSVLERHPEIYISMKNPKVPDISIELEDTVVKCSIVPFPEAGYIGIYGYMIEYTEKVKEKVALSRLN